MTEEIKRLRRVCFTGHRPEKLNRSEKSVLDGLETAIRQAIVDGSNPYELIEEITEQCLHRQCSVIFIICLIFGDAVDVSSSRLGKEVAQCDSQRNADTLNRGNA